ncbi:Growth arrest-specific protein 1 [Tupaia chinensis]|uniref:Growth arrest-specific protein 1 n=1 Tax=Tupaia chinensis TaxID=246437 RepID=L9LDX9_TUPCH|nr:Growth arrest-specific protein 1 [Tupaia chinensis]
MGCTEARRRCDRDSRCNLALSRYLTYCGKLFNGLRCTDECRTVIEDMLAVPKAALLNDCVCDGLERPICESVKENMARLCFGAELGNGPGSSGSDGGLDDYSCPMGLGAGAAALAAQRPKTPGPRSPPSCCCCSGLSFSPRAPRGPLREDRTPASARAPRLALLSGHLWFGGQRGGRWVYSLSIFPIDLA